MLYKRGNRFSARHLTLSPLRGPSYCKQLPDVLLREIESQKRLETRILHQLKDMSVFLQVQGKTIAKIIDINLLQMGKYG